MTPPGREIVRYAIETLDAPSPAAAMLARGCAGEISADDDDLSAWARSYAASSSDRIAADLDLLERFAPPGGKVIEMGSAPFLFTLAAQRMGYDVTGVDIDPSRFSTMIEAKGLRVLKSNFEVERVALEDGAADLIAFHEVFEHLRIDLIATFEEVFRLTRPGGIVLVSTPNLRSVRGIRNFLQRGKAYALTPSIYDEYAKLRKLGHMGHVREYTPAEVTEFLSRAGFEVVSVIFRGLPGGRAARAITRAAPTLRPVMTVVIRRPGTSS